MKNVEIVGKGFSILRDALAPYIADMLKKIEGYDVDDAWWYDGVVNQMNDWEIADLTNSTDDNDRIESLDVAACLMLIDRHWNNLFCHVMQKNARSWAKETKEYRNQWAHIGGGDFSESDTARALDTMARLAGEASTDAQAEIESLVRTALYGSEQGSVAAAMPAEQQEFVKKNDGVMQKTPVAGLKSWRNVITPHPDVAQGRYKNAEFAADLAQVARGEGAYEYRDPVEFFNRTYVTEGMKGLLTQALRRVGGLDGEPVIQLKTAFGGGKTHSMLALYHLLRGRASTSKLPQIKKVIDDSGVKNPPICRVAVLVGTALDPAKSRRPVNLPGVTVNTLWGEMAAQLAIDAGVPKLYDFVKEADKRGVSPGSQTLKELFDACGPCVILIDELVAYAKKLYKVDGLPAGSFDNLISFIQEITEAARASSNSLVVASIPESNIEIGGDGGQQALDAIEHTFGRMESIWKPVNANEGFEIVRRRLFLECNDTQSRDQVCMAFSQMYQDNSSDFPTTAKEVDYLQRMKACYPIHPEIFDRLYEDWATIEHFQKTRGVLRLMAAVIHNLWMNQDGSLLIMPGSVGLDVSSIRDELTRHVGDEWNPIVDREVDGRNSIPYQKDQENYRFGQYMAVRRVARTIMLGSAPKVQMEMKGIEASRIRLGVVQPGENIAVFNDALNTLRGALSYLYSNPTADRYWYDTRPTLRKMMEDRASQRSKEEVEMEIERRLKQIRKERPFARLHVCPESSMDVSDDMDAGVVILKYRASYRSNQPNDDAIKEAELILNTRGLAPRNYRNMLSFIAADHNNVSAMQEETKRFLAWKSIKDDAEQINLDTVQLRETDNNLNMANKRVEAAVMDAYCYLLVPYIDLEQDMKTIQWDVISLRGGTDTLLTRAARKMDQNEQLITQWSPALLKIKLDELLWKDSDSLNIGAMWKQFCTYCYLPKLADINVLIDTISAGVNSKEYFAYAAGICDEKYTDLKFNQFVGFVDRSGYVVKKQVAIAQIEREKPVQPPVIPVDPVVPGVAEPGHPFNPQGQPAVPGVPAVPAVETPKNRHFFMTDSLDNVHVIRDVSKLMDEVINQLSGVDGSRISIKLVVEAEMPNGTPVPIVRGVTENCRTLRVDDFGFDD